MHSVLWMHNTKDQLYETIKDIQTKDEFEKEIAKRKKDYGDLIDEDAIALLIVDGLGRNKQNISNIADLESGLETTVFGKITNISKTRNFTRKNGSSGTVANLDITDDTGTCRLVLWNRDVELVTNKTIQQGTNVKIINGYTKDGFNGIEINTGRWSLIEIEPEDMPTINNKQSTNNSVKGTLIFIEPTNAFFRDNGEIGFVTNIKIKDKDTIKQITVWDKKVKEIQQFKKGASIEIVNIDKRQKNGSTEFHVNGNSIIKKA